MTKLILPYLIGIAYFWFVAYQDRQYPDQRAKMRGARIFFLAPLWPLLSLSLLALPYFIVKGLMEMFAMLAKMWRDAEWRSLWRQTSTS